MLVVELAIFAVIIAGMWKLFVKAGQPGWAAIVPIYNTYVMTQIVGRPILWFILTFVPCVNFVAMILIMIDLAKSFGKSTGYAIGMVFLPFIFIPMLGFGDAQYSGPSFKG
ncbi:MAG: signal peptidase I [Archangium sp.]|nr:signal peptidase I [Archangium sp.]